MARRKRINKVYKKKLDKKCFFCSNDNYACLNVHRIAYNEENNQYIKENTITVCSCCHNKIHDNQIVIDRKYQTTLGKWLLHYWENGEEKWGELKYG